MIVANPASRPTLPIHVPVSLSRFVTILDAASSLSPAFATLTKNTRGGVCVFPTQNLLSSFDWLATSHSSLATKSIRIRTYAKPTRNPFTMNTSKTRHLKSFRIRTYEKIPGGPTPANAFPARARSWYPAPSLSPFDFQPSTPSSQRVSAYPAPPRYPFPFLRLSTLGPLLHPKEATQRHLPTPRPPIFSSFDFQLSTFNPSAPRSKLKGGLPTPTR